MAYEACPHPHAYVCLPKAHVAASLLIQTAHCLRPQAISHIDLLSLDIEGHELSAVHSIDWDKVSIDVIISEDRVAGNFLVGAKGYRAIEMFQNYKGAEMAYLRPGFQLAIESLHQQTADHREGESTSQRRTRTLKVPPVRTSPGRKP